jgi:hypothetical protein
MSTAWRMVDGVGGVTNVLTGDSCFRANVTVVIALGVVEFSLAGMGLRTVSSAGE